MNRKVLIKKALKSAIGPSVGITIGGCILPRLFFVDWYNNTYPPIWKHAILYLLVGYITAFLVFFIISLFQSRM